MSSVDVYNNATEALTTLSNLWQAMLQLIQAVSDASASSLTVEPDLVKHQRSRKEYEELKTSLNATITWLEKNKLTDSDKNKESKELSESLQQHAQLQEVNVYRFLQFLIYQRLIFYLSGILCCIR